MRINSVSSIYFFGTFDGLVFSLTGIGSFLPISLFRNSKNPIFFIFSDTHIYTKILKIFTFFAFIHLFIPEFPLMENLFSCCPGMETEPFHCFQKNNREADISLHKKIPFLRNIVSLQHLHIFWDNCGIFFLSFATQKTAWLSHIFLTCLRFEGDRVFAAIPPLIRKKQANFTK